ncbi:MAG: alpha/beta hydrolase [Anaerolineales bacterium]
MPYLADLYYQAYHADDPNRKPLVLIHGAGGEHLSWPSQVRRLASYRVYSLDLPGHGKSRRHGLQRISAYAEIVISWLNQLELPRVFLCGHSMGGAIALWIAVNYPDRIQGLILIGTGARLPVNLTLIEDLADANVYTAAVENICRWSFSIHADPRQVTDVKKIMLKTRPSVLQGDFRACAAFNLTAQLDQVQAPTLIVVGEQDKMTPLRFSEELEGGIQGADLVILPQTGHMVPLEKPQSTADLIRTFLRKVTPY